MFENAFHNQRVLVTGHTGFKGAWLCEWLLQLEADVYGIALEPPTTPSLFEQLHLAKRLHHQIADVRDREKIHKIVTGIRPAFVFHMAAQPLVRTSYDLPVETYETNVMGTVHLLDALRSFTTPCHVVIVTTDKCYDNKEWNYGYRENDSLGGHDPYSSSKAATEIVVEAFRRSYFYQSPVRLASARAGNVIGGGDWAKDRIVPDCIRALQNDQPILVRNKSATRPWQHVIEPLSGYLWLAARLVTDSSPKIASPFNFGPTLEANRNVAQLVEEILKHWSGRWEDKSSPSAVHEAGLLHLSIDKSKALLGWSPVWKFGMAIEQTVQWYQSNTNKHTITIEQIKRYVEDARSKGLPWAKI